MIFDFNHGKFKWNIVNSDHMKQRVIIVGAGFAGIQLARNLNKDHFDILLIDKLNHHQFQSLFYQVATSQIEPSRYFISS